VEIDEPMHKKVIVEGVGDAFCWLHRTVKQVGVEKLHGVKRRGGGLSEPEQNEHTLRIE
jgi:hypothetical protein